MKQKINDSNQVLTEWISKFLYYKALILCLVIGFVYFLILDLWVTPSLENKKTIYIASHLIYVLVIMLIVKNVQEALAKANEELSTDPLTLLPNRKIFKERLSYILRLNGSSEHMVAVLLLGLDRFKIINDSLGYTLGDQLMQTISARLTASVRNHDYIFRMRGDEFAIIIPHTHNVEEVVKSAQELMNCLSEPFLIANYEVYIHASIGISLFPNDGTDANILLQNAETAMYRAKEAGLNQYQFYTDNMHSKAMERLKMENDLRRALERRQFFVCYQPQIDLSTGRIMGVEALLRWKHPEWGIVSPSIFIPLAEENGLISEIGEWVLREACKQAKAWQEAGFPPIRMSVNLSVHQFQHTNLQEIVQTILQETSLDGGWLTLEITESVFMNDVAQKIEKLLLLKQLGVHIAIDDFGTGYSSLSYLKQLPIDYLKIDKSFINDITENPCDIAITTAIITLAHHMKFEVVAEGVETREQLDRLASLGCDNVQGYYFTPPIRAERFEDWMKVQCA